MKHLDYIVNSEKEILAFLKSQYPLYHMSNIFFRDIQYGIQKMFERRDVKISYRDAEKIAKAFVAQLERKKILVQIDSQSWVLHYPEFRKQPVKPVATAKSAGPAAAVPRPAAGVPPAVKPASPGTLPPLKSGTPASLPPLKSGAPSLPPLKSSTPVSARPAGSPSTLPPLKSVPATPNAPASATESPGNDEKKSTEESN